MNFALVLKRMNETRPNDPAKINFIEAFESNDAAIPIRIGTALEATYPHAVRKPFKGLDYDTYESRGMCKVAWDASPIRSEYTEWGGLDHDILQTNVETAIGQIVWRGSTITIAECAWRESYSQVSLTWLISEDEALIDAFALDVYRTVNVPHEAVLVFSGGCWNQNHEIYRAMRTSKFESLILNQPLIDGLRSDFQSFLKMRSEYEALNLPWRRGVLFVGPPGNGKTQCVRALAGELNLPTLYVQSLKAKYETEEALIARVFSRARQLRPCLLVFEDLDALITDSNRSVFLNQMDGFERNVGMIVIATTNHPEKLDASILDRPSRFDRKYHFPLPTDELRQRYIASWKQRLAERIQIDGALVDEIVLATEGFSFAYLQELFVSSLMRVAAKEADFTAALRISLTTLREQMRTGREMLYPSASDDSDGDEDD
jgi:ATPase family associated with various cellular activities (AAA)